MIFEVYPDAPAGQGTMHAEGGVVEREREGRGREGTGEELGEGRFLAIGH